MGGEPNGVADVDPGDFELKEVVVKTRGGSDVHVLEMTLRQRDAVATMLKEIAADPTVMSVLGPLLGGKGVGGGEVEIDMITVIRAASDKVSTGWLTRLLCEAVLNAPENKELTGGPSASMDWALDNLRLSDENALLNAFKSTNDLGKYLGNLMGLISLGAQVKKDGETTGRPPPQA